MKDVLISVILPTYNRAVYLPTAIKSVITQSYRNWELIIVDDGSTDNTRPLVDGFRDLDSRIRYFYQENRGAGAARNLGMKNAGGSYVTFLDSDDYFHSRKLELQLEAALKFNSGIILCFSEVKCDSFLIRTKRPKEVEDLANSLLSRSPNVFAGTPLLFIDLRLICSHDICFDESLPAMEDFDLLISLSRFSTYKVVNEVLYTENRFSIDRVHSIENVFLAELLLYRKYPVFFGLNLMLRWKWIRKSASIYHHYGYIEHSKKLYYTYSSLLDRVILLCYLGLLKVLRSRVG